MNSAYDEFAPRFIERGMCPVPIRPGEKRPMAWDPGREAWVGLNEWQTRDPITRPQPGAGIGVRMTDQLAAADLDDDDIAIALMDVLPDTPVRKVGARGETLFFRHNGLGSRKYTVDGKTVFELLASGTQTVVPPTRHPGGMDYRWSGSRTLLDTAVGDLPELTEDVLAKVEDTLAHYGWTPGRGPANGSGADYWSGSSSGRVDIDVDLSGMAYLGRNGGGSVHATQLKCSASLLRSGCTVDCAVETVLAATRKALGDKPRGEPWDWLGEEHGIREMAYSFINKNPELTILLPDSLREKFELDVAAGRKAKIIYSRHVGWHVRSWGERVQQQEDDAAPGASNEAAAGRKRSAAEFVLHPFVPFDLAALPPRQWLYGRHYQRGVVSATIAPGGFGKTTLDLVEFVAMATCRNLLGEQPEERLRCWYHNGEDSMEELNRRLGAICLHYGIPQEELQGWFFMTSGNEVPLRVANGYSNLKIDRPLVARISDQIDCNKIDVAGFDPLVTLHNVPKRDPGAMDTVVRIFAGIADAGNCGVELAHHTRKLATGVVDYTVDDIRGASSIRDAVRAARMLNQMTSGDAEDAGIPEHERSSHFRVDRVKGNNAPASKAVWRRFVNVELPNGDDVGVVTPWDHPEQGGAPTTAQAAAARTAEAVFLATLDKFLARGTNVTANFGANYAPAMFAKEKEARLAKVSKAALTAAMRALLDNGRIRSEPHGRGHRLVTWTQPQGVPG